MQAWITRMALAIVLPLPIGPMMPTTGAADFT